MLKCISPLLLISLSTLLPGYSAGMNPAPSQASGHGGTVEGKVLDPSGAVVAGAAVVVVNAVSGYSQKTESGPNGLFRITNVPLNQYSVQVAAPGFQPASQSLSVRSSVPMELTISLVLANSTESVTVEATADEILENVASAHTDADQSLISRLPTTGTAQGLSDAITMTTGGVVADSNGSFHPQGDHGETSYVVDEQPINDQQSKTFSTQLPANAFQSLELVSGAPGAEFGNKTSLVVSAVTRSGLGQKPHGSLDLTYGTFGTAGEEATWGVGGSSWGNFLVVNTNRSGRFLDSPEWTPFHDKGSNGTIFDRFDVQPSSRDAIHFNIFGARNWFQIPDTYDQLGQDQRQRATTFSVAPGYQHTFNANTVMTIAPFFRQDRVTYYPSQNAFDDTPATLSQDRHLTNWGLRGNVSYNSGVNNIKIGTELTQTRLVENFSLGITDPNLNPPCNNTESTDVLVTGSILCGPGQFPNPAYSPGLGAYDLTRGGTLFHFHGKASIDQQAIFAQDQVTLKNLTLSLGLRLDHYDGISTDTLLQPRFGISYLIKPSGTVLRAAYSRTMETPYNENLVLSSTTGTGGLASNVFGAFGVNSIKPGHRNQFNVGFQQAVRKFIQIDADYFWKFTKGAFDFDTLFNTSIAFPISWRQSKLDGVSVRVSTANIHGFQVYTTLGHTRARFFGPETGGILFNSPITPSVFRIDHDQALQQTTFLRYQFHKDGPWFTFTWRYDSGEVAGAVDSLGSILVLTPSQQADIGFACGSQKATVVQGITACDTTFTTSRINIPSPGTSNLDHNPPRIAPRNLFDIGAGTDNLFHTERLKTTLKLTAINISNEAALYNFLSTFSGTHWVSPRTLQVGLGWNF